MQAANEVVCAGILVADHVCTPADELPEPGRLVAVDAMYLLTGGCAANVAVNVAKQGVAVSAVGKIGDDYLGRFVRDDLCAHGVDTSHVTVAPGEQTSQSMVLLCKGQDRRFIHTFGANRRMSVADIPPGALDGAGVFYVGGYLVLPSLLPTELAALFRSCRDRGIRTVLDVVIPNGFTYGGELSPVLPHTDVFLPNNDEAAVLTVEEDPIRQAEAFRTMGARTVIITLGGDGLLFTDEERIWRASHFASEVLDQTGAGDAFCAGFITGMVRGRELARCVEYGSALGASCVRSIGCCDGVFDDAQAAEFVARHRLEIYPA